MFQSTMMHSDHELYLYCKDPSFSLLGFLLFLRIKFILSNSFSWEVPFRGKVFWKDAFPGKVFPCHIAVAVISYVREISLKAHQLCTSLTVEWKKLSLRYHGFKSQNKYKYKSLLTLITEYKKIQVTNEGK